MHNQKKHANSAPSSPSLPKMRRISIDDDGDYASVQQEPTPPSSPPGNRSLDPASEQLHREIAHETSNLSSRSTGLLRSISGSKSDGATMDVKMQEDEGFGDDMFPEVDTPPHTSTATPMMPMHESSSAHPAISLRQSKDQSYAPATNFHEANSEKVERQGGQSVYKSTGYRWSRDEDAPGYGWKNKKAIEDYHRASDQLVDKDKTIGRKYGDIGLDEFKM